MAERHAEDRTGAQGMTGAELKRRGILGAAGIAVAGMVAKQAAQPVAAAGNLVLESTANTEATGTGLTYTGAFSTSGGALSVIDDGGASFADVPGAVVAGVGSTKLHTGVYGQHKGSGTGVYGVGGAGGTGVSGTSNGGSVSYGVWGRSDQGYGVFGSAPDSRGTGVYGYGSGFTAGNGNGVHGYVNHVGSSQVTAGVFGDSDASYGVVGRTTAPFYSGCTGIATVPNTAAFAGSGVNGATCAYFTGATIVEGNFTVVSSGMKNAAVKHTDGSYRLLHCVESPEPWFEDFGEAKLVNGKAEVKLDADFAAVVETASYHVFIAPSGDSKGLYTTAKGASGFTVWEQQAGTSSLTFSYRIVAKRKNIAPGRMAKFELPKIRLPKPEEMPPPPAPPKKP